MSRVARWARMTEGQAYTVLIGLAIGLTTVIFGIPPALRQEVTRQAGASLVPSPTNVAPHAPSVPPGGRDVLGSDGSGSAGVPGDTASLGSIAEFQPGVTDTSGELASGASALGAGSPTRQGWWTSLSALRPDVPGVALPATFPPDVPEDGLYVAGGSDAPQAYAALMYQVPQGVTATTLTLVIAPNSFTSPASQLLACPIRPESVDFAPVQGGDAQAGPTYDCAHGAKGVANPAANSFSFDVGALVAGDRLAVAIVPSLPSDRVVFSRPGDDSLSAGSR